MNFFKNFNNAIDFIEGCLFDEEIDLQRACKILSTNLSSFKNTFSLLTGYTVNEYIKLRRLSECVKFLQQNKIIDIAIMCGYNSRAAFSRAFKKFHGFNPSQANGNVKFNYLSRILFNEEIYPISKLIFEIKNMKSLKLYGLGAECASHEEIKQFHKSVKEKYDVFKKGDLYYGLVYKNRQTGKIIYYLALDNQFDYNNKLIKIPASRYLSISLKSPEPKEISRIGKLIKSKTIYSHPDIEIYKNDEVEMLYKI